MNTRGHFAYRSSSGVVFPDFGVAILALFLICYPTVWNPKSKEFWEQQSYSYLGEHLYYDYRSSSGVGFPDIVVAILALFLICSHPTVWNPKSKDFWKTTSICDRACRVEVGRFLWSEGVGQRAEAARL